MYRISKHTNRITKLEEVSFSELGFSERNHPQEWLANQPDALGEELLAIQAMLGRNAPGDEVRLTYVHAPASRHKGRMNWTSVACGSCLLVLAGCGGGKPPATAPVERPAVAAAPAPTTAPVTPQTDRWVGRWTGPEGTFLQIEGAKGRYELVIRDLDGPRRFAGTAEGARIAFERNGQRETLQPGDGKATGMKWLADKKDCLVVRAGEGYCRG